MTPFAQFKIEIYTMNGLSFLNDFRKKSSLWTPIGEVEIPASDGSVLIVDDSVCCYNMHSQGTNFSIVQEIADRGLNCECVGMATGKSKVFGFVAKDVISLGYFLNEDLTPLSTVALTQNQLVSLFDSQQNLSTEVLACDIPGRKNITFLRHGEHVYYLEVALYEYGFPTFDFFESIEGVFLQPGEGLLFVLPSEE